MALIDEGKKWAGARPYAKLTLTLDTETAIYSHPAHREAAEFWAGRIMDMGGLRRAVEIDRMIPQTSEGWVDLDNADGVIGTLLNDNASYGSVAQVDLVFKDSADAMIPGVIYKGILETRNVTTPIVRIAIKPAFRDSIGILQRSINSSDFPNAQELTMGQGLNIILGDIDAQNRVFGAVYCPVIDHGNRKVCVAQHACKLVDQVIREQDGAITNLTLTVNYTVNTNDTDANGNTITTMTIDAGSYQQRSRYYAEVQGIEDNGDGTGTLITDPSAAIKQMLIDHSNLVSGDFDATSWSDWTTLCSNRSYTVGGVIPWIMGELIEDPLLVLEELGKSFDAIFWQDASDKVFVDTADVSTPGSGSYSTVKIRDLTTDNLNVTSRPFNLMNKLRAKYKINHRVANFGLYDTATDEGSIAAYGETVEGETGFYFVRDSTTMEDVVGRLLLRRGGYAKQANFTANGFQLIDQDLTDIIEITHAGIMDGWVDKQFFITAVEPDLLRSRELFECVSVGDVYGPVKHSAEAVATFTASVDTYVDENYTTTAYGSSTALRHRANPDFTLGIQRACYRFDISAIDGAGGTVQSATLKIYVTYTLDASQLQLRQLLSTDWSGASTWNAFDNGFGDAWAEANIGGTQLANATFGTTGFRTFILNSSGITYLEAQKAGNIEFSHQVLNDTEGYDIASNEHAETTWRPKLIVTYTT